MGDTFSERKLTPHDSFVHVYGDAAWSELVSSSIHERDRRQFHLSERKRQQLKRETGSGYGVRL